MKVSEVIVCPFHSDGRDTRYPNNQTISNLDLKVVVDVRKENRAFFVPGLRVVRPDPSSDPPPLASQLQGHLHAGDRPARSVTPPQILKWGVGNSSPHIGPRGKDVQNQSGLRGKRER